ncbi:MAG: hypothetical protein GYA17_08340 [Chloroflexi bacterium]|jgi:predicted regulator of Ras-like GTPase activity (Roadblock/LC7/MglB family)|nr:hypothetical protein [Chloroflexota bacterium]
MDSNWNGSLRLRVGITIYPAHDRAIERVLADLMQRCPAQFVLVTDVSGLIISTQGDRGGVELVGLASLVAADLAASQEIARLTGQYQSYQLILREGSKTNTFISEAGHYLVLFTQVGTEVPLGWARFLIREASCRLEEIISTPPDQMGSLDLGLGEKQLSDVVGDALDAMWTD